MTSTKTKRRPYRDNRDMAAFLRRVLAAYGRKVQDSDPEDLTDLLALDQELQAVLAATVTHMRTNQKFTWEAIGRAAGISRQAAQQKWGITSS